MPWTVSERPIAGRLPVRAGTISGYERVTTPNPNEGTAALKRQGIKSGTYSMLQSPEAATAPLFAPSGESALSRNVGLEQRAVEQTRAYEDATRKENMFRPIRTVPIDRKWAALQQALFEAGADRVRTGARAGWQEPGFFDTQSTYTSGYRATPREQALMREMELAGRRR